MAVGPSNFRDVHRDPSSALNRNVRPNAIRGRHVPSGDFMRATGFPRHPAATLLVLAGLAMPASITAVVGAASRPVGRPSVLDGAPGSGTGHPLPSFAEP